MDRINHKIEPKSILDAIAKDPLIRTIDGQVRQLFETSTNPVYIDECGNRVKGPQSVTEKRIDYLLSIK